jgi:hypothetical protein
MQRIGSPFGVALVGSVFAAYGHLGAPASFVAGLRPGIAVAAGLALLGAVAALAIPQTRRAPVGQPGLVGQPAASS